MLHPWGEIILTPPNACFLGNQRISSSKAALGAIAPGYQADLLLLPDLEDFVPEIVLKRGRAVEEIQPTPVPEWVTQSVRVGRVAADDFAIEWEGGRARVIGFGRRDAAIGSTAMRSVQLAQSRFSRAKPMGPPSVRP